MARGGSTAGMPDQHAPRASADTNAGTAPSKCHLMALPPELRNKIWEHAVLEQHSIAVAPAISSPLRHMKTLPGITQTSRQIRSETLPIYLAQNTFSFSSGNGRLRFENIVFGALTPHFDALRHVEISFWAGGRDNVLTVTLNKESTKFEVKAPEVLDELEKLAVSAWASVVTRLLRNAVMRCGKIRGADLRAVIARCLSPNYRDKMLGLGNTAI